MPKVIALPLRQDVGQGTSWLFGGGRAGVGVVTLLRLLEGGLEALALLRCVASLLDIFGIT